MNDFKWLLLFNLVIILFVADYCEGTPDHYIATGGTVTLSTTCSDDNDCDEDCNDDSDTLTITWTSSRGGTFTPGGSTGEGESVSWQAPSSSGDVRITATCDDDGAVNNDDPDDTWVDIAVVEVDKIQYDDPDTGYTDISGTLYVHKGTTVTFKAIPDPSGASWPSGKPVWGGTSGASGTGSMKAVTFNTLSSSTSDYKTVTAECGNTVTANVIVFDFTGILTPDDDFSGRSQSDYGLEEIVDLNFTTDPTGITAAQAGGLEWSEGGRGSVSSAGNDGTATYDAEELNGAVTLGLVVQSGPSKDNYKNYWRYVIKPTGTRMTRYSSNVKHVQGSASAGIALWYWLDPKTVSFSNLTFGEGSCPSTSASGFYLTCSPWNSYPTGTQIGSHSQNTFGAISGGNSTNGCNVIAMDGAYSGAANPYAAGSFTWSIPTQYIDDTATRNSFGSNQNHVSTYQSNGDATQAKGGQSGTALLNDATSGY